MPIDPLQSLMMNESFEAEIDTFFNYYEIEYKRGGIKNAPGKYFEVCRNRYLKSTDYEGISNYGGAYTYYSIHQFENFLNKIKDEVAYTNYDFDEIKVLRVNGVKIAERKRLYIV